MNNKVNEEKMRPSGKRKLIPKFRFPEFRESGEWVEAKLGELGELIPGLTYSPDDIRASGLLVLRSSNVQNSEISLEDNVYVTPDIKGANLSEINDILICVRNGSKSLIGKNALIPEGMPLCTHGAFMTVFRANSAKFVFQLLQTSTYQKQVDGDLGATINSINGGNLIKYKFYIPECPHEQKKIADFLSYIDALISVESQKLKALKNHKKGLMQQLFPTGSNTLPQLRFAEFRHEKEWQKKKVSDLLSKASNAVDVDFDKMYRQIGIRSHGKGIFHKEPVSGKELGEKRVFYVEDDAFVVNIVFAWEQAVANTSTSERGMIASHRFPMYKAKAEKSHVGFIKYFFLTGRGKHLLGLASPGGAGRNKTLGQKEFENLEFLVPAKAKEQSKIFACLSSIDELMIAQTQKIDVLNAYKKGMLRKLFVAIEEVQK
jgi:type I restriction enzyme S subunit